MSRGFPRRFDWEAAARDRAAGMTYPELGKKYGVTGTAVFFAVRSVNNDPRSRARYIRYATAADFGITTEGTPNGQR